MATARQRCGPDAHLIDMRFRVMRADDNGNEVEVTRVETREEAERIARDFEARGHKQMYWIEPIDNRSPG